MVLNRVLPSTSAAFNTTTIFFPASGLRGRATSQTMPERNKCRTHTRLPPVQQSGVTSMATWERLFPAASLPTVHTSLSAGSKSVPGGAIAGFSRAGSRMANAISHTTSIFVNGMPFQALYNAFGPPGANNPQNQGPLGPAQTAAPGQGPSQSHGILISFAGGTAASQGAITVTNGTTGTTVTKPLPPNSTAQQCMQILQQAALQAGLQIQTQAGGAALKVFGLNNAVNVTEASVAVSQF